MLQTPIANNNKVALFYLLQTGEEEIILQIDV